MPISSPIRILAPTKLKGDLFTRLVSDLFLALGYDAPRLNVHKTGREIDVEARHRTEPRRVLAECKATAKPIGGDEVNKFAGAVDRERRRSKGDDLVAYFISLSGFTESAVEQELEIGGAPRLVLLDGKRVAEELVHGRIVVSSGRALERAGRVSGSQPDLTPEDSPQLLGHEIGWIWAIRFRRNAQATHVALVHADGELLASSLAEQVLAADRSVKGDLFRLTYLPPHEPQPTQEARLEGARQAYFRYLAAECGQLELEGLPADQEIGTKRLRLESLFVPLHLQAMKVQEEEGKDKEKEGVRLIVGAALERRARLAILALPGGGKTTLLKRLAVAYAFPDRRADLGDHLPDREWFPLFLRCRQLGSRAEEPITELLAQIGVWAELGEVTDAFRSLLYSVLREGRALLLVDGLDEIADPGSRVSFVTRLRTFLSTYPGVDMVVTSREAGFRIVAGALNAHCDHYRIADFDNEDIERLTVAWHREVVGDRKDVEEQARALAQSIWETDRVRRLAVNPLLLTTLLLVRRWVGQLPSRRSVLYEKAIEVLLMTWNLQGFEPLDLHEVKPQLAFLAWQMMEEGAQRVSEPRLKEILREARRQMPEVLDYARLGVDEFVERVERRSGVLVLSGNTVEDGRLVPVYEFRHLTFQEYLAALALVEGNYSGRTDQGTLVSKLETHFKDEAWKEAIPLVAVLAGRGAAPLIEALAARAESSAGPYYSMIDSRYANLLTQCLLGEVQIPSGLLKRAIEAIVMTREPEGISMPRVYLLAGSRYRAILREIIWNSLASGSHGFAEVLKAWQVMACADMGKSYDFEFSLTQIEALWLGAEAPAARATALMFTMTAAFRIARAQKTNSPKLKNVAGYAANSLQSPELWEQIAGAWALAWLAKSGTVESKDAPLIIGKLLELWASAQSPDLQYFTGLALQNMPLVSPRKVSAPVEWEAKFLMDERMANLRVSEIRKDIYETTALLACFYASFGSREQLVTRVKSLSNDRKFGPIEGGIRELLGRLGKDGKALLLQREG
jgi:NACHT domain/Restriction endonuclease